MAADCSIKAIVHAILMESTSNSEMRKSFGPVAPYHPMSSTMNELMIFISLHDLLKKSSGTNLNLSQTHDSQKQKDFCPVMPSLSVHPATRFRQEATQGCPTLSQMGKEKLNPLTSGLR